MSSKDYISKRISRDVYKRDGYQCRYCGDRDGPFHLDHVYPESKGGATSSKNLVVSCASCNHKKHAKIGVWPYPIGYFNQKHSANRIYFLIVLMLVFSVTFGIGKVLGLPVLYIPSLIFSIGFTFSVVTHR